MGKGITHKGGKECILCTQRGKRFKYYKAALHLNVSTYLIQLFFIVGIPHVITFDQGSEFNNTMNAELMQSMGIEHRLTTAYHPQANGLDEVLIKP